MPVFDVEAYVHVDVDVDDEFADSFKVLSENLTHFCSKYYEDENYFSISGFVMLSIDTDKSFEELEDSDIINHLKQLPFECELIEWSLF